MLKNNSEQAIENVSNMYSNENDRNQFKCSKIFNKSNKKQTKDSRFFFLSYSRLPSLFSCLFDVF